MVDGCGNPPARSSILTRRVVGSIASSFTAIVTFTTIAGSRGAIGGGVIDDGGTSASPSMFWMLMTSVSLIADPNIDVLGGGPSQSAGDADRRYRGRTPAADGGVESRRPPHICRCGSTVDADDGGGHVAPIDACTYVPTTPANTATVPVRAPMRSRNSGSTGGSRTDATGLTPPPRRSI